jgi:hypothetical protein
MLTLVKYLLSAMMAWVPLESHAPLESVDAAAARYEDVARDIAEVTMAGHVEPLFDGADGRARTALLLASIASHESRFDRRVDDGSLRGDHGVAWGLFQVHCYGKMAEGWTCHELVRERQKGVRVALRMARQSFAACRGLELGDRLSVYTTGKCYRGQYESRARVNRAMAWMITHPWKGCPADMVESGETCVDRYEAPNMRGALPLAFQTAIDGEVWCAARGRLVCEAITREPRKRLCSEEEWTSACEGTLGPCNDEKNWRPVQWSLLGSYPSEPAMAHAWSLYQAMPSGAHAQCVSTAGAMDMLGNVAEWVTTARGRGHALKGCYWAACFGGSAPSCRFANRAHPGTFRTYEAGFRCCRTVE